MRGFFLERPVFIAVLAVALGTVVDAIVKGVAPDAGLFHLVAWRFFFGALIALTVFQAQKRPIPSLATIRFHTFRGSLQLIAALLFFYALTQLGLAQATIIGFTASLMVPFLAWIMLGERVKPMVFVATLAGFLGAALAISARSGVAQDEANQALGLIAIFASAGLYAFVLILLRMRARHEDATTIVVFTNLVPAVLMLPVLLGFFGWPDWRDLPVFALLGFLGFSVWYLMTLAYARADAQILAPIEYSALIWSSLLGAVFFSEYPSWQLYVGAVLIIASCLVVAFADHFATRRAARMPSSDLPE